MRLKRKFYKRDALLVAKELLGKRLVRRFDNGEKLKVVILETEAYKGQEDLASHARFGKTQRNKVMFEQGGLVYVYLIYGIYWMLNVITGEEKQPQGVLIRGVFFKGKRYDGPGKVTRLLGIDKKLYGEDLVRSRRLWIEEGETKKKEIIKTERIGVEYAGVWAKKKWRFLWNASMESDAED
jgi:DNA-3-methyladenine glycosylase